MTILRRVLPAEITTLGEDEVEIRMSTGALARDGHILVPEGCILDNYRKNPIQLWQHDPNTPVGRNEDIRIEGGAIVARSRFAKLGVSAKADEVRGLVKDGIVNAVSVGFDPLDGEPLDPKKPRGGQRFVRWELLECSFVSVPADTGAVVTARANGGEDMADWKCGAARDLPIEDGDPAWDSAAAEKAIFDWAGGDEFDPAKARQGFLAYDAAKPSERGSYKLPFVHVVDGKLEVPKSALRAASGAHGVGAAEIGDAKDEAQKVLDHYKEKAGVGDRAANPHRRQSQAPVKRGMYGVAQLAYALDHLGFVHESALYEAAIEEDNSRVPGLIMDAIKAGCTALLAMTEEECAEMVSGTGDDDAGVEGVLIGMAAAPAIVRFRKTVAMVRAGKALSKANAERLARAQDHHEQALDQHKAAEDQHRMLGECYGTMADNVESCRAAHERLGDSLDACRAALGEEGGEAADALGRCMRAHKAMGRNLDAITEKQAEANDAHEGTGDAHRGIGRHVRAAKRAVDAIAGDEDVTEVQTSTGAGESGGSANDRSWRRRRARLHALKAA